MELGARLGKPCNKILRNLIHVHKYVLAYACVYVARCQRMLQAYVTDVVEYVFMFLENISTFLKKDNRLLKKEKELLPKRLDLFYRYQDFVSHYSMEVQTPYAHFLREKSLKTPYFLSSLE